MRCPPSTPSTYTFGFAAHSDTGHCVLHFSSLLCALSHTLGCAPHLSVILYTYSCPLSHTLGCAPLISVISYTYSCPLSHTLGCAPFISVILYTYSCPLSHTLGCAPLISVISYTYSCPLSHTLGCAPHACCSRPPGLSRGTRPGGTCTERACTSGSGWSPGSSTTL